MLFGPNHVAHSHRDVVNHIGQQKHRRSISAQQHKVFNGFVGKFNASAHQVIDHGLAFGNAKAQHSTRSGFKTTIARVAVVTLPAIGL